MALVGGKVTQAGDRVRLHPTTRADVYDLLAIENIGNLVCPAAWTLGEDTCVVASATEGDDKLASTLRCSLRLKRW